MEREKFLASLKEIKRLIESKAERAGLNFSSVLFEIVDFDEMNALAATGGFPVRWSHWVHGQEFERLRKFYKYGLSIIYEMVVNTDPAYAYLLNCNSLTDHKIVMAHVYGHCDFFKNNIWVSHLNTKMLDEFADHAIRIERYKAEHGHEAVEKFIDDCLSIVDLIDPYAFHIKREKKKREKVPSEPIRVSVPEGKRYLDDFLNPLEWLQEQREELKSKEEMEKAIEKGLKLPAEPTRDVLAILIKNAPLEEWQRDVLAILREEAYYFAPQGQTRIMNEGWASYWHSNILTEMGAAETREIIDYALHCAGTWARHPISVNPYRLGLALWRDIEWRWDTGRHGPIYERCDCADILETWDDFIVFNTFSRESLLERRWDEWCAFKETLSKGLFGFPKEAWNNKKAVKWWCDYRKLLGILKKGVRESSELKRKIGEAQRILNSSQNVGEIQNQTIEKRVLESSLEDLGVELNFYLSFSRFRAAFNEGNVPFKRRAIPQSYISYAERFKGEEVEMGKGLEKIFEVRTYYNDINFVSEFFTDEFCTEHQYYTFEPGGGGVRDGHYGIDSTDPKEVRQKMLFLITNLRKPIIYLTDANHEGKGEFYLNHLHEGVDLNIDYLKETLKVLYRIWQKTIYLETIVTVKDAKPDPYGWLRQRVAYDPYTHPRERKREITKGEKWVFSFDGSSQNEQKLGDVEVKSPFRGI